MNSQEYNLNIRPGVGIPPIVRVSQDDVGRPLAFKMYDGASALTIASGTTIEIHGTKRSGLGFTEACTWSGSTVSVDTTEAMTQESGAIPTELVFTSGTDVIASANFMLVIEPSPHSAAATDGTVAEAINAVTRCETYAQAAEAAETAVNALIATIPADYTSLTTQVATNTQDIGDIKADLEDLQDGGYIADAQAIQEKINAWLVDHPEATTTVQDGAIIEAKLSEELINKIYGPFYDVTKYGIAPNTNTDLYEDLFDFLHDTVAPTGGIVYFPPGEYLTSDSLFIPPNTIFLGSGHATVLKFTEEYPSFGVCLSNGGSNVGVVNMTVDCSQNGEIISSAMTGGIGFGTRTFASWTTKHRSPSSHASCSNLFAENLWTNTRYILQTETSEHSLTVENVQYRNINAKNSLVSVMGDDLIKNVVIENVDCAWLRIGTSGSYNITNVTVSNIRTGRLFLYASNVSISDMQLLPDLKYDSIDYSGAVIMYGNIAMTNCFIDATNYRYAFARLSSSLRFVNVHAANSTGKVFYNGIDSTDPNFDDVTFIGCRFETASDETSLVNGRFDSTYFPTISTASKVKEFVPFRTRILENDDLDDYKTYGKYFCSGANHSSVSNVPGTLSAGFYLDVDTHLMTDDASACVQRLTSLYGQVIYVRTFLSNSWSRWYKYEGTAV